jgi:pimeloyl-ACP methyl ester carboxylesterase
MNAVDGVRTYFEDAGGIGPPVLFYTGFADPLEVAKSSRLARALSREFRLVFADHRGQGGSDKPHEPSAYALQIRVDDAIAVLDTLGIDQVHFIGASICAGEADEMHDAAKRAAGEIPGARFVSLAGHSHISAFYEADDLLLPHILEFLRSPS